jgi:hypothetical protein
MRYMHEKCRRKRRQGKHILCFRLFGIQTSNYVGQFHKQVPNSPLPLLLCSREFSQRIYFVIKTENEHEKL